MRSLAFFVLSRSVSLRNAAVLDNGPVVVIFKPKRFQFFFSPLCVIPAFFSVIFFLDQKNVQLSDCFIELPVAQLVIWFLALQELNDNFDVIGLKKIAEKMANMIFSRLIHCQQSHENVLRFIIKDKSAFKSIFMNLDFPIDWHDS